jgi:hypothetical protein
MEAPIGAGLARDVPTLLSPDVALLPAASGRLCLDGRARRVLDRVVDRVTDGYVNDDRNDHGEDAEDEARNGQPLACADGLGPRRIPCSRSRMT